MIRIRQDSHRTPAQTDRKLQEVGAMPGTITVKYAGELDREFKDYLAERGVSIPKFRVME